MSIAVPLYGFGASGGTGGTLTVTAPANVTVTVSKDGKTKTKNSGTSGVVVFKGLASGTWTLKITDGSQTSSKPVVVTADYSTVIAFFAATINVTYPSGSTCTATDGTTTLTAPDTSGTWACVVPNEGTWTVSSTDGDKSKSANVAITTNGQSESVTLQYILYLFKDNADVVDWSKNSAGPLSSPNLSDINCNYGEGYRSSCIFYTANKIDVTGYNSLIAKVPTFTSSGALILGILVNAPSNIKPDGNLSFVAKAAMYNDSLGDTMTVDLSTLSGEYYVAIQAIANWGTSPHMSISNVYCI